LVFARPFSPFFFSGFPFFFCVPVESSAFFPWGILLHVGAFAGLPEWIRLDPLFSAAVAVPLPGYFHPEPLWFAGFSEVMES